MLSFLLGIAILTFECMTAAAIYQEDGALIDRKVTYWEIRHGF